MNLIHQKKIVDFVVKDVQVDLHKQVKNIHMKEELNFL